MARWSEILLVFSHVSPYNISYKQQTLKDKTKLLPLQNNKRIFPHTYETYVHTTNVKACTCKDIVSSVSVYIVMECVIGTLGCLNQLHSNMSCNKQYE